MHLLGDVPLFVEHCEAAVAEVDVTRRWLDEQGRRELSFSFDVLAERHGVPEVACAPSIVGSLLRLPVQPQCRLGCEASCRRATSTTLAEGARLSHRSGSSTVVHRRRRSDLPEPKPCSRLLICWQPISKTIVRKVAARKAKVFTGGLQREGGQQQTMSSHTTATGFPSTQRLGV